MRGLADENGVIPPEMLPTSQMAHPRLPVFGATLFCLVRDTGTCCSGWSVCAVGGSTGDGPVFAKSCCALGCVESCRSPPDDARVAMQEDVGGASAVGTGQDLAGSKIVHECCHDIEAEAHGVE